MGPTKASAGLPEAQQIRDVDRHACVCVCVCWGVQINWPQERAKQTKRDRGREENAMLPGRRSQVTAKSARERFRSDDRELGSQVRCRTKGVGMARHAMCAQRTKQ